ncbi:MAG: type III polyketide synthase [Phycisphaerae bacterium]
MNAFLAGIGLASPHGTITSAESVDLASMIAGEGADRAAASRLATGTGIRTRSSVLWREGEGQSMYGPPREGHRDGPGTAERLREATRHASELAEAASRRAMAASRAEASSITHVVTASCTVLEAPGFDQALMEQLGLDRGVRRTNVGFMGCHAAINALAMADAIVRADPRAVALVCCVELCSLHMHYSSRPDRLVANALFADGAAACVVRGSAAADDAPAIRVFGSRLFGDERGRPTREAMAWSIGDHGFEMTLSPRVPRLLETACGPWIDEVLRRAGLSRGEVGGWAIHPGGPRVVEAIAKGLDLSPRAKEQAESDALGVLADHGNMSSATVLFILERLASRGVPRPWVAMAFGPGLAGEAMVVA